MGNWIIVVAQLAAPVSAFAQNVNVDSDPSAACAHTNNSSGAAPARTRTH